MYLKTDEIYKKYGIDINKLKKDNNFKMSKELVKKLENTANRFLPLVCAFEFEKSVNDICNQNYADVYSSDVFETIIGLCKEENIVSLKRGSLLYRARIVDEDDLYTQRKGIVFDRGRLKGYDWINSKEPPIGLSPDGRANSKNSSYFYCSEDGNTAASEIKASIGDLVSLASFKTKRSMRIVDFSNKNDFIIDSKSEFYIKKLVERFSKPIKNSKDYNYTQFISDEIRKCGVDGICYTSYFTQSLNYVIFNCSTTSMCFIDSRILKLHSQQLHFVDYSSEVMLATKAPNRLSDKRILKEKTEIYNLIKLYSDFGKNLEGTNNGQIKNAYTK